MKNRFKNHIIVLFFLPVINLMGQVSQNDSIKIISDLNKAQDFTQINIDSSHFYVNVGYKAANKTKSKYLKARAAIMSAIIYQSESNYKTSTRFFKEGITLAEESGNRKLLAQGYNGIANMFALQKQFNQASDYFNKALEICKEINDTTKVSVILMNLANIEYNESYVSNNYEKTNKSYAEAYRWAILAKDTAQQISCLGNWGLSYSDESRFDSSLEKLNKAVELANSINYRADLIYLKHYLGRTYGYMKEYPKAIDAFTESLQIAIEFKDINYQAEDFVCLANTYSEIGDYKQAFEYFKKYKNAEDTLTSSEITNELNSIKVKYDTEKKQKEIELLKVNANKNKIVNFSLIGGSVLLLGMVLLVLNRYRLKEKTNKLLESQNAIISEKNKDISDSINYAKRIQDAILPEQEDIQKVFPESFVLFMPKDVVSGDFYWFTQHQHLKFFVAADCTGHGVPGALMSMIGNTLLNSIVNERKIFSPNIILNELRKEIISVLKQAEGSQNKDGMDISLCCFNTLTKEVEISCANNPVWILKHDGTLLEIKPDKQPIGFVSENQKEFTKQSITLNSGDWIYQFTDGFADQFGGEKGKKFKYNQLKEILIASKDLKASIQSENLKTIFLDWKGNLEQIDDVLITGIQMS